ncbi:MAG: hypothetical protein QOF89_1472 [Acidobacteriota bacterium]|jgi:hypothetical protein|nr:hypothetical protein [Acidobacteriota bacterium]
MNRKNIVAGAVLLSGFLMASHADAFGFFKCSGNEMNWNDPFQMVRNKASFPPGSGSESSLKNAIGRWNGVQGMADMVSLSSVTNPLSFIETGDGQNDVALTNRNLIGGNNGLTLLIHNLCVLSSSWVEADVLVANDLMPGHVAEDSLMTDSQRVTFLHEFGHVHGLGHSQHFNNMRTVQPRPVVGGTNETVDVLPDDANGGRFLYPNGNFEINLFASAQRKTSGDQIVLNNTGTKTFCSSGGATITLNATVGNNGTIPLTSDQRWWVSTSADAHSVGQGIQIFTLNNTTFAAGSVSQQTVAFKMPALPAGTYFLFHGVDGIPPNESRDDDNAVREAVKIKVNNC